MMKTQVGPGDIPRSRRFPIRLQSLEQFWQKEDGANLVLMALVLSMLLGFAALAVDGSNIYFQSQRMQISADAAALGGARKLAADATHGEVDAEINALAISNHADTVTWNYINDNRGVYVVASRAFPAYFARIYGNDVFTVTANAKAQYEPVTGVGGLFPFTVDCNCDDTAEGGDGADEEDDEESTVVPEPESDETTAPTSGTVELNDNKNSSYGITYMGQTGNTWTYEVEELDGRDLSHWLLGIDTCLSNVVGYTPAGADIGTDGSTGVAGIKWDVGDGFTSGTFSFTLDDAYPAGYVDALAKAGPTFGTVSIRGPICDGSNTGDDDGSSGTTSLCLPTLEFESDTAGAALVAGQIIDTEWAAWGVHVTTHSPGNHPAMIFNSANPSGGDFDLGTPNEAYGGPGVGAGGGPEMPAYNNTPLGKVLIVAENANAANPDDSANGGTLIFTFDYPVRIDDVKILDIDDASAAGTVKTYSDTEGGTLVATGKMLGLGDNSVQTVTVNGSGVRRMEIKFPKGGAVASIVSCRTGALTTYTLSNLVWNDLNGDGIQDAGEPGIGGVKLELYTAGQNAVLATTTSNTGGEYLFSNLPNGNYEVKIAASNFQVGNQLFGASYSPQDATDDTLDSDFDPATGRAVALISSGDNSTVDGGFTLHDPGPQSAIINVDDNQNSTYEIKLISAAGNTWTYRVREVSGHHLDEWGLGLANCLDNIVSYTPMSGYASGVDSGTGFNGIRWDVSNSFKEGIFSFTLDNSYQAGPTQALVKANGNSAQVAITGPDCSLIGEPIVAETPEEDDTPGSGGSSGNCACEGGDAGFVYGMEYTLHEPEANAPGNFGWLRWAGDGPSTVDLEYNINHPDESPILFIGDWVQGTTGIKNSILLQTAFEQWIGKEVTIPIYNEVTGNGANVQYRICTFAVFELIDYDRSSKTIRGRFVRSLIRSQLTDPAYPDVGARDVRMIP